MLSSAQLKEAFDGFDKDKSGALSFDEVAKLVQSLGAKSSKEDLEKMFKGIDTNADGTLSFEEFLAWYRVGKSSALARTLRYQLELLSRSKKVASLAKSGNIPPPE
jgi:EF-hand domain pair